MSSNKKNKVKGTVLYTVVAVMSILTVLVFAAMTLASSANRRTYNSFANSQTYYTARSVIDIVWKTIIGDDELKRNLFNINSTNKSMDVIISGLDDKSMGEIVGNKAVIKYVSNDRYKVEVTVRMLGQENTVAAYYTCHKTPRPEFNYGITTINSSSSTHSIYAYGSIYPNVEPPRTYSGATADFELTNNSTVDGKLNINGNFTAKTTNRMHLVQRQGLFVCGDISIYNNTCINTDDSGLDYSSDENLKYYRYLPYIHAYRRKEGSRDGGYLNLSSDLNLGTENKPVLVFVRAANFNSTNEENIYGDLYLYGEYDTTKLGAKTHVKPWNNEYDPSTSKYNEIIKKKYCGTDVPYNGGNIYSLGTIEYTGNPPLVQMANNVVAKTIKLDAGNGVSTTGAVVAQNVNILGKTVGDFDKGLFVDPDNFVCEEGVKVNGIEYKRVDLGEYSIVKEKDDGNYNPTGFPDFDYWNQAAEVHNYSFRKSDFLNLLNPVVDAAKAHVIPKSVSLEWRNAAQFIMGMGYVGNDVTKVNIDASFNHNINGESKTLYVHKDYGNSHNKLYMQINPKTIDGKPNPENTYNSYNDHNGSGDTFTFSVPAYGFELPNDGSNPDEKNNTLSIKLNSVEGYADFNMDIPGISNTDFPATQIIAESVKITANVTVDDHDEIVKFLKAANDVAFENNGNVIQIDDIDKSVRLVRSTDGSTYSIYRADFFYFDMDMEGNETEDLFVKIDDYPSDKYDEFLKAVVANVTYPESMGVVVINPDASGNKANDGIVLKCLVTGAQYNPREPRHHFFIDDTSLQGEGQWEEEVDGEKKIVLGESSIRQKAGGDTEFEFKSTGVDVAKKVNYDGSSVIGVINKSCTIKCDINSPIKIEPPDAPNEYTDENGDIYIVLQGADGASGVSINSEIVVDDSKHKVKFIIPKDKNLTINANILTKYYKEQLTSNSVIEIPNNPLIYTDNYNPNGSRVVNVDTEKIPDIYFYMYYDKDVFPHYIKRSPSDPTVIPAANTPRFIEIPKNVVVSGYFMAPSGKLICNNGTAAGATVVSHTLKYFMDIIPADVNEAHLQGKTRPEEEMERSIIIGGVITGSFDTQDGSIFIAYVNPNPTDINGNTYLRGDYELDYYQAY